MLYKGLGPTTVGYFIQVRTERTSRTVSTERTARTEVFQVLNVQKLQYLHLLHTFFYVVQCYMVYRAFCCAIILVFRVFF
jgi:peptide methionine sulfoxide reductase MsrA